MATLSAVAFLTVGALVVPVDATLLHSASPVPVASTSVNVTVVSYSFLPNLIEQVPPNVTIHLNLLDADAAGEAHTFTIYKEEGVVIGSNASIATLLYSSGAKDGNLFNENATGVGWWNGTFTAPATGWYEFVSTEPGQFQVGMYGFIAFGEDLPANLTISPQLYALTFAETILPPGTNWSVTLTGNTSAVIQFVPLDTSPVTLTRWSDGTSTIRFNVSNGNYSYSASAAGYSASAGNLTVGSQNVGPISVGFTAAASSPSLSSLDYVLLGVVIGVAATGASAVLIRRRGRKSATPPSDVEGPPTQP